jgi:hypothetical protein
VHLLLSPTFVPLPKRKRNIGKVWFAGDKILCISFFCACFYSILSFKLEIRIAQTVCKLFDPGGKLNGNENG